MIGDSLIVDVNILLVMVLSGYTRFKKSYPIVSETYFLFFIFF